ncbi:uncharacterized protein LOC127617133 [Xyrauchen texanus]|uniref:uncharacterized protein LOC127617133 n=1 Tax=Xyrauchen texanus TaxID=154827 RepID=UPI0022423321|nr:uncharacterized protein LOC127617133 [Xyrauchen texanus]
MSVRHTLWLCQLGYLATGCCVSIAKLIDTQEWTEKTAITFEGIPKQVGGNNCGIYILMYTLYMALGLRFDFTEDDMPLIRRWWCALILDNFTLQIAQPDKRQCLRGDSDKAEHAVMTTIYQLPNEIVSEILKEVVLATGDSAYLTLSLVCRWFRDVVTNEHFRKAAHFAWLDSVVNWKIFSQDYCKEFRQSYSIRECSECLKLFKSCPPGYRGRGRRGELLGFYSEDLCAGFCSQDCFLLQEMSLC